MFTKVGHGEQSIVGFLKLVNSAPKFVKIARDISFITQHEYVIMKAIQKLCYICPFFCCPISLSSVYSKSILRIKSETEIFSKSKPNSIPKFALQMEYITGAESFDDWAREQPDVHVVWAIIQQVVAVIKMAYDDIKFTHYDLHTDNVLVRKTTQPADFVRIFKFADGTIMPILCGPVEPVIIDFGRAYSDVLLDTALNVELYNTHAGLFSVKSHPIFDILFFLNCCAELIERKLGDASLANNLQPFTKEIDENGWWKSNRISALDSAASLIKLSCTKSRLFEEHLPQALIIFSHLCIIPFETVEDYAPSYFWPYYFKKFFTEWMKIEKWFSCEARLMYFFSFFVSALNIHRENYFESSFRDNAGKAIQSKLEDFLNIECSNKWSDDNLNWHELIRCGYLAGQMLESLLNEIITIQEAEFSELHSHVTFEKLADAIPKTFVLPLNISGGELIDATTKKTIPLTADMVTNLLSSNNKK